MLLRNPWMLLKLSSVLKYLRKIGQKKSEMQRKKANILKENLKILERTKKLSGNPKLLELLQKNHKIKPQKKEEQQEIVLSDGEGITEEDLAFLDNMLL